MFLGLRTVIYPAPDLAAATAWWTRVLGQEPYFNEPFYVGFDVGGYELGLDPEADPQGPTTYWGVRDADHAIDALVSAGAEVRDEVREVGGGIRVAAVTDRFGNVVGVIENPAFEVREVATDASGPGR